MKIRYFTVHTLLGVDGEDLPLYGVYMEKMLNKAGNFNGTFLLDTGQSVDPIIMNATTPGEYSLFVEVDGRIVWGGPIWTRTYQSSSRTIQLTAQTFESVFEHVPMLTDQVYDTIAQETILDTWLTSVQAQTGCDFGLVLSADTTGITRSIEMLAEENRYAVDLLNVITQADDGLDVTINMLTPTDRTLLALQPDSLSAPAAYYEYPGQISNYWYTESAIQGAIRAIAQGQNVEANVVAAAPGSFPYWTIIEQFSDISDQALIDAKANQMLVQRGMPSVSPTFELDDIDAFFRSGMYDKCGSNFKVHIEDARFPEGKDITSRMLGWAFTPEQTDTDANLKFVLENDE